MKEQKALTCSYGAGVLRKHLYALRQEVEGVRLAEDIEAIHRMRVASRRLRSAIPMFADCYRKKQVRHWLDEIKGITRALGTARDTDVQLDLLQKIEKNVPEKRFDAGMRRLILRISQQRKDLQGDIALALDRLEKDRFYDKLDAALQKRQPEFPPGAAYPHNLYERSAAHIQQRLDDFLSFEPYIHQPECVAELHAMRIAAKQLRYTMEVFAPIYPGDLQVFVQAVKTTQELLGDIHDCDVWLAWIPEFIEEEKQRTVDFFGHANPLHPLLPGFEYFRQNRQETRNSRYQEFTRRWDKWQAGDLWAQLRASITAPLYPDIFPPAPDIFPDETE